MSVFHLLCLCFIFLCLGLSVRCLCFIFLCLVFASRLSVSSLPCQVSHVSPVCLSSVLSGVTRFVCLPPISLVRCPCLVCLSVLFSSLCQVSMSRLFASRLSVRCRCLVCLPLVYCLLSLCPYQVSVTSIPIPNVC